MQDIFVQLMLCACVCGMDVLQNDIEVMHTNSCVVLFHSFLFCIYVVQPIVACEAFTNYCCKLSLQSLLLDKGLR